MDKSLFLSLATKFSKEEGAFANARQRYKLIISINKYIDSKVGSITLF